MFTCTGVPVTPENRVVTDMLAVTHLLQNNSSDTGLYPSVYMYTCSMYVYMTHCMEGVGCVFSDGGGCSSSSTADIPH